MRSTSVIWYGYFILLITLSASCNPERDPSWAKIFQHKEKKYQTSLSFEEFTKNDQNELDLGRLYLGMDPVTPTNQINEWRRIFDKIEQFEYEDAFQKLNLICNPESFDELPLHEKSLCALCQWEMDYYLDDGFTSSFYYTDYFLNKRVSNLNPTEIYMYCRAHYAKSYALYRLDQYDYSYACAQSGIHFMIQSGLDTLYPTTYTGLIKVLSANLFGESEGTYNDVIEHQRNKIIGHLNKYSKPGINDYIQLAVASSHIKDSSSSIRYINLAQKLLPEANKRDSMYYFFNVSNLLSKDAPDLAIEYALTSLNCFPDASHWYGHYIQYYISNLYSVVEDFNNFKLYLSRARNISTDKFNSDYIIWLTNQLDYSYCSQNECSIKTLISILTRWLADADKVYPNRRQFHISDLYSDIVAALYSLANDRSSEINTHELNRILSLTDGVKNRFLELGRMGSENDTLADLLLELEKYKSQTNDFLDTTLYGTAIYDSLYTIYEKLAEFEPEYQPFDTTTYDYTDAFSPNEQYLIFHLHEYSYGVLLASKDGYEVKNIKQTTLNNLGKQYYSTTSKGELTSNADSLFNILFPQSFDPNKTTIVFNDGITNNLPLDEIISSAKNVTPKIINHYNLKKYLNADVDTLFTQEFACFYFSDTESIADYKLKRDHTKLVHSIENISFFENNLLDASLYSGFEADEKAFKDFLNHKGCHLATHAASNPSRRQDNYIIVRNSYEKGRSSALTGYQIQSMLPTPKFISIATCESGIGDYRPAEITYSLSRIFLEKGTNTVVKTLWRVDDQHATIFVRLFYENWLEGLSAGDALHKAKIDFLQNYPKNNTWAAFAIDGNPHIYLKTR